MVADTIPPRPRRRVGAALIGVRVRTLRTVRLLRQDAVAQHAKISAGYLSHIESGRRRVVNPDAAQRIAEILRVPLPVLTGQQPIIGILRLAQRIDADTFAREVGIGKARLDRIELGSELPDPDLLTVMATRLGVDPAALATSTDRSDT